MTQRVLEIGGPEHPSNSTHSPQQTALLTEQFVPESLWNMLICTTLS